MSSRLRFGTQSNIEVCSVDSACCSRSQKESRARAGPEVTRPTCLTECRSRLVVRLHVGPRQEG